MKLGDIMTLMMTFDGKRLKAALVSLAVQILGRLCARRGKDYLPIWTFSTRFMSYLGVFRPAMRLFWSSNNRQQKGREEFCLWRMNHKRTKLFSSVTIRKTIKMCSLPYVIHKMDVMCLYWPPINTNSLVASMHWLSWLGSFVMLGNTEKKNTWL